METFEGRIAVVTGGGSGMGRELVVQLAADGCSVATCDVREECARHHQGAGRARRARRHPHHDAPVRRLGRAAMNRFRDEVLAQHETDHVNLVFNNAGIGGGGSFVADDRAEWDKTFAVCWGGVYNGCRAFIPLLIASDDGYLVNTSSVNGFWASLGPGIPHTAYSAAKFAVKGFTEALLEDFRINAPHVKVAVVMPGHIGTDIVNNSRQDPRRRPEPEDMTHEELEDVRREHARRGIALGESRRRPPQARRRDGQHVPRQGAADRGGRGEDHPRRRARRRSGASSSVRTPSGSTRRFAATRCPPTAPTASASAPSSAAADLGITAFGVTDTTIRTG